MAATVGATSSGSSADPAAGDAAAAAAWIEQLHKAIEAASAEARGALFYYGFFGLYFAIAVAGTSDEDLLRGATVAMPGLGIGMPIVGFYAVVPVLFVVFHAYAILQLIVLARRIGSLQLALRRCPGALASRQRLLVSPFAISQRLFGEPRGVLPQLLLRLSTWLTLVLLPLVLLLATQVRFLPYHMAGVTWAHRAYILFDALLVLFLWPVVKPQARGSIDQLRLVARRIARRRDNLRAGARASAEALRRRGARAWKHQRLALLKRFAAWSAGRLPRFAAAASVLFIAFFVATVPPLERGPQVAGERDGPAACGSAWRFDRWLAAVRLPDGREVPCLTYRLFEAPATPFGLRRNLVVRDTRLVLVEPSLEDIAELGLKRAWEIKGEGLDLRGRDLRFADFSGSDLRRADLRGANLQGAVLKYAKLVAARAGNDIERAEIGACTFQPDDDGDRCLTGLVNADLSWADLRLLEGWRSDFQGADLTGARLQDAQLSEARLDAALLVWARLDRAKLDRASLTGAVLREASAPEVGLNEANLGYAFLRQAHLVKANPTGIDLERTDLGGIKLEGATWLPDQPYGPLLLAYWMASLSVPGAELELTVDLFERACRQTQQPEETEQEAEIRQALETRGVIQRLWHEFDYSKSHDQDGYAEVADLRYLLARVMLGERACPRAVVIDGQHKAQLQRFVKEWCRWRFPERDEQDGKEQREAKLAEAWDTMRGRIVEDTPEAEIPTVWKGLDQELGPYPSCEALNAEDAGKA